MVSPRQKIGATLRALEAKVAATLGPRRWEACQRGWNLVVRHRRALTGILLFLVPALILREYLSNHPDGPKLQAAIAARAADGEGPSLKQYIPLGLAKAARVNLALCLLLAAGAAWWTRPLPAPTGRRGGSGDAPRWFWWTLAAITLSGAALRLPLATRSLWVDELWNVKHAVVGHYYELEDGSGQLAFKEADWPRALWFYNKPTNHVTLSVTAKLAHSLWARLVPHRQGEFSDFVIRLPCWLAAAATIGLSGWLLARWGMPREGLLAALLLAVHPWAWQYGVEARGYSFLMLAAVAGMHWLTSLGQSGAGRWWPWAGFALNQLWLVWSFLHGVWLAITFTGAAAVVVWGSWPGGRDRGTALIRLAVVNLAAAMVFGQLFAPNLMQMAGWLDGLVEREGHRLSGPILAEWQSRLWFGLPLDMPHVPESAGLPSFAERFAGAGIAGPVWILFLAACLTAGLVAVWHRGRLFLILGTVLAGGALALGYFAVADTFFYHRFVVYLVIPVMMLLAAGAFGIGEQATRRLFRAGPWSVLLPWLAPAVLAAGMTAWAWPQMGVLLTRELQPLHPLARAIGAARAEGPVLSVAFGANTQMLDVYDPETRHVDTREELAAMVREARAGGRRLLLSYGARSFNAAVLPEALALAEDRRVFRVLETFAGSEPNSFFWLCESTGAE